MNNERYFLVTIDDNKDTREISVKNSTEAIYKLLTGDILADEHSGNGFKVEKKFLNRTPANKFFDGKKYKAGDRIQSFGTLAKIGIECDMYVYCIINDNYCRIGKKARGDGDCLGEDDIQYMLGDTYTAEEKYLLPGDNVYNGSIEYTISYDKKGNVGLVGTNTGFVYNTAEIPGKIKNMSNHNEYKVTATLLKTLLNRNNLTDISIRSDWRK